MNTTWEQKIRNWLNGNPFTYPKHIRNPFMWNTNNSNNEMFAEEYLECSTLPTHQDYSSFQYFIENSKNRYVVSFYNLPKDTILVIPKPRNNKNFATLKHFVDNASEQQQVAFWKHVAQILKKKDGYYVSVHGCGVPYLHVRISKKPKHYFAKHLH